MYDINSPYDTMKFRHLPFTVNAIFRCKPLFFMEGNYPSCVRALCNDGNFSRNQQIFPSIVKRLTPCF